MALNTYIQEEPGWIADLPEWGRCFLSSALRACAKLTQSGYYEKDKYREGNLDAVVVAMVVDAFATANITGHVWRSKETIHRAYERREQAVSKYQNLDTEPIIKSDHELKMWGEWTFMTIEVALASHGQSKIQKDLEKLDKVSKATLELMAVQNPSFASEIAIFSCQVVGPEFAIYSFRKTHKNLIQRKRLVKFKVPLTRGDLEDERIFPKFIGGLRAVIEIAKMLKDLGGKDIPDGMDEFPSAQRATDDPNSTISTTPRRKKSASQGKGNGNGATATAPQGGTNLQVLSLKEFTLQKWAYQKACSSPLKAKIRHAEWKGNRVVLKIIPEDYFEHERDMHMIAQAAAPKRVLPICGVVNEVGAVWGGREHFSRGGILVLPLGGSWCPGYIELLLENITSLLAEGVAPLHDRGLSHGDLKPDNMIFWRDQCWLIDFGSSRLRSATEDSDTLVCTGATMGWRAPELVADESDDSIDFFAADIYGIGCMLIQGIYDLVRRKIPSLPKPQGDDKAVVAFGHLQKISSQALLTCPSLRWLLQDAAWVCLCQAALNQNPEDRPSALEFARSLSDIQKRMGKVGRDVPLPAKKKKSPTNDVPRVALRQSNRLVSNQGKVSGP